MTFRIGRSRAQHSYPATPRPGVPQIIQMGSDLLADPFSVTAATAPKVEKTAGTLLQVPLPGFRRANGLWIEATALVIAGDTSIGMSYYPWFKFASLAQYFVSGASTLVASGISLTTVSNGDELSVSLSALIQLPSQSDDGSPIALPAVDDLLVGLVASGGFDYSLSQMTTIVAAQVNSAVISQNSPIGVITLP